VLIRELRELKEGIKGVRYIFYQQLGQPEVHPQRQCASDYAKQPRRRRGQHAPFIWPIHFQHPRLLRYRTRTRVPRGRDGDKGKQGISVK
jgi:hypothetical protein